MVAHNKNLGTEDEAVLLEVQGQPIVLGQVGVQSETLSPKTKTKNLLCAKIWDYKEEDSMFNTEKNQ